MFLSPLGPIVETLIVAWTEGCGVSLEPQVVGKVICPDVAVEATLTST
jgi:hypothetical protein